MSDEDETTAKVDISTIDIWLLIIMCELLGIMIILMMINSNLNPAIPELLPTTTISITSSLTTTSILPVWVNCQIKEAALYYSPSCPYCQAELKEGGLAALQRAGVTVTLVDVTKGNYSFIEAVPTWVINNQTLVGYRTVDQIGEMFGCQ